MYNKKSDVVVKTWCRPGDRNPNILIFGIRTKDGSVYETCGNYGKHEAYPNPIEDIKSIRVGEEYVIVWGPGKSYPTPTFIGIAKGE